MVITLLALFAIRTHTVRRAEQRRLWEEEEAQQTAAERALQDSGTSGGSYEVH